MKKRFADKITTCFLATAVFFIAAFDASGQTPADSVNKPDSSLTAPPPPPVPAPVAVQSPSNQESHSVISMSFIKQKVEHSADSIYFNILKIHNDNGSPVQGKVHISLPRGWKLISPDNVQVSIAPGNTEVVPIRVSVARTVTGGVSYLINATLTSDRPLYSGKTQNSVTGTCYVTFPKKRNWNAFPVERTIYFDRYSQYTPLKLRLINKGNGSEVVKLDMDIGSSLELYGSLGRRYFTSVEVRANSDTVISFPFKYAPVGEDDVWNRDFRKLTVRVSATVDTVTKVSSVKFKYLESSFFNNIYGITTPLNLDFQLQNLLSESNPRMLLGLHGLLQFRNMHDLNYTVRFSNLPFYDYTAKVAEEVFWKRSRMIAEYRTNKWKVIAGDINAYHAGFIGGFGRGIGGDYKINLNHTVGGAFTAALGIPMYTGTLFHELRIKNRIPLKYSIVGVLDNYNKINTYGMTFQTNYNFMKSHSVFLLFGPSYSQHVYNNQTFTDAAGNFITTQDPGISKLGFFTQLGYQFSKEKFSAGLNAIYTTRSFSQYYNGRINLNGNAQYILNKRFQILGNSGLFLQDPLVYNRGLRTLSSQYLSGLHKAELATRISNKLTLFAGPLFEHLYFKSDKIKPITGDTLIARFNSYSPKLSLRANYKNNISGFINPYAMFGYTFIDKAEDSTVNIPPFFTPHNRYFNVKAGLNVVQGNWGVNVYYYLGPYSLSSQTDYYYFGRYSKSLRIMPFFQKYYFNKTMLFTSYNNYSYEVVSNSERISLNARLKFFLGKHWTYFIDNNLFLSSRINSEGQKVYARTYYLNMGITKAFDIPQPRIKYYDINIICFKDVNGNQVMDENEHGLSDIVVTIDRRALSDSAAANPSPRGQFAPAELVTSNFGRVDYYHIPQGDYEIHVVPLLNLVDLYNVNGQLQKINVSRDTTFYVPFAQSFRVLGNIIVNRDEFSAPGNISLGNIRIVATDSLGNSYPSLSSADGSYVLYVPRAGNYKVTVNNVFGEQFVLQENEYTVAFDGAKEFQVDFIFNEKRRKININGSSTSVDSLLGRNPALTGSNTTLTGANAVNAANATAADNNLIIAGRDTLKNAKIVTNPDASNAANPNQPRSQDSSIPVGEGITYRIQLTSTRNQIPPAQYATRFKGIQGITEYTEDGVFKYTASDLKTLEDAKKLKAEIKAKGFNDAFMVPFYKNTRVRY